MNDDPVSVALRHPWVGSADWDGASVVVRATPDAVAIRPEPGPLLAEHLQQWQQVYEYVYSAGGGHADGDLDLSGWSASDTGQPFRREHMLEWIGHAVDLVLRRRPSVVLELGCGSGLIAHRVHDHVRRYVGVDVAAPVIERLRQRHLPGVRVRQGAAHDLRSETVTAELGDERPDCIVLNSVTECFPNQGYLTAVVEDAIDLVAAGGQIVVGDVRNWASAALFAHWLERALEPSLHAADLTRRVTARIEGERELLVDPRVFTRIAGNHRRDVRVSHVAKPLRENTELTRYRYDVVLTVDGPIGPQPREVKWSELAGVTPGKRLAAARREIMRSPVVITGIPHALLTDSPDAATPSDIAAAAPPGYTVLLDDPQGTQLALGPVDHATTTEEVAHGCNDPFDRFVRRRLPQVLADHLEHEGARPVPIVVAPELVAR
ncbi:class I SAM-dependent methyltransferase [Nocardia sp. CNY236]|uniref:class I SAM-dependent methyltransferase n=1 Tax=Nocardia sp. CNY236 TaxID=1169152 RepID=UPI0004209123|nr:class I SAM-dependent methyltransferase [Nocardia sp. CNY236]